MICKHLLYLPSQQWPNVGSIQLMSQCLEQTIRQNSVQDLLCNKIFHVVDVYLEFLMCQSSNSLWRPLSIHHVSASFAVYWIWTQDKHKDFPQSYTLASFVNKLKNRRLYHGNRLHFTTLFHLAQHTKQDNFHLLLIFFVSQ